LPGNVYHSLDRAADRRAIDVHVEHRHEDRDARDWLRRKPGRTIGVGRLQLGRRRDLPDQRDQPVGRGDDQVAALRHYALRIAEEREHPERGEQQRPAEPADAEPDQDDQRDGDRAEAELAPFGMDRRPGPRGVAPAAVVEKVTGHDVHLG
jgi:hypothetical protein